MDNCLVVCMDLCVDPLKGGMYRKIFQNYGTSQEDVTENIVGQWENDPPLIVLYLKPNRDQINIGSDFFFKSKATNKWTHIKVGVLCISYVFGPGHEPMP